MKSITTLAFNATEQEYRSLPNLSYSRLSGFFREGPESLRTPFSGESSALRQGSLFDTMLTEPENLSAKFHICDNLSVTDVIREIVTTIYKASSESPTLNDVADSVYIEALGQHNYYNNWTIPSRIKKVISEGAEYFNMLKAAQSRTIVSTDEYNLIKSALTYIEQLPKFANRIINNPFTNDMIEGLFQTKFITEINNIPVKIMFDRLVVDHINKKIYPLDIKTTGYPEEQFEHSVLKWRYDIQAELYTDVLKKVISTDEYFKDFQVMAFEFIVINVRLLNPIIWVYDKENLAAKLQANNITHYTKLLEDASWHIDNNVYTMSKETYENDRLRKITIPFLK